MQHAVLKEVFGECLHTCYQIGLARVCKDEWLRMHQRKYAGLVTNIFSAAFLLVSRQARMPGVYDSRRAFVESMVHVKRKGDKRPRIAASGASSNEPSKTQMLERVHNAPVSISDSLHLTRRLERHLQSYPCEIETVVACCASRGESSGCFSGEPGLTWGSAGDGERPGLASFWSPHPLWNIVHLQHNNVHKLGNA